MRVLKSGSLASPAHLIGKYVCFIDGDTDTTLVGLVKQVWGDHLYLRRERSVTDGMPVAHFLLSITLLAENPFNVDIFDSLSDVDLYFKKIDDAIKEAEELIPPTSKPRRSH